MGTVVHVRLLSQVRAADNGSPPRHTDHSLTINILDVNDNAPVIESQKGYNVSISEVRAHSVYKKMHDVFFFLWICMLVTFVCIILYFHATVW